MLMNMVDHVREGGIGVDEHGRSCEGGTEGVSDVVLIKKGEHGRSCEGGTDGRSE